jgi:hypothetical protein
MSTDYKPAIPASPIPASPIPASPIPASEVSVLFTNRAQSFGLSNGATFAELAERVDEINSRNDETPTAVSLTFTGDLPAATATPAEPSAWVSFLHRYAS